MAARAEWQGWLLQLAPAKLGHAAVPQCRGRRAAAGRVHGPARTCVRCYVLANMLVQP